VNCHRQEEGHSARPVLPIARRPANDRRYVTVAGRARPQRASDAKGWRKMNNILVIEDDDEPIDACNWH
jgi:hypothetical protein